MVGEAGSHINMEELTVTHTRQTARHPEDLTRLFVARANERDADGMAELYAPDAVLAYPPGQTTIGRDAIRAVLKQFVDNAPLPIGDEGPLPTLRYGDIALCATPSRDGTGIRVQVTQRQPDGSWLRIIDRPESHQPAD
jgi:ketosteroid isomerase-like protein